MRRLCKLNQVVQQFVFGGAVGWAVANGCVCSLCVFLDMKISHLPQEVMPIFGFQH